MAKKLGLADLAASPDLVQQLRQGARASTLALDWSRIAEQVEQVWARLRYVHAAGPDALPSVMALAEAIARMGRWRWVVGTNLFDWSNEIYRIFGVELRGTLPCKRPCEQIGTKGIALGIF